jgi:hypothetical protein
MVAMILSGLVPEILTQGRFPYQTLPQFLPALAGMGAFLGYQ